MREIHRCSQPDSIRGLPDPVSAEQPLHQFWRVSASVEGCVDRKLKQHRGDRPNSGGNDHDPSDKRVDAPRHPENQPDLEYETNRHRCDHKGLDQRLLRSVICLEGIGGDKMPGAIVDETLHPVSAEAIAIQQNDSDHQSVLIKHLHHRVLQRLEVISKLRGDEVQAASGRTLLQELPGEEMLVRQRAAEMPAKGVINLLLNLRADETCGRVSWGMRENADELFAWLERGAFFYVCGDASRMAKDVELALLDAIAKGMNGTPEQAAEYLAGMKKQKRYQRDVY